MPCERIERLCKGPNHAGKAPDELEEDRRPTPADDDIPF
jgi:hypothetical protein